MAKEKRSAADLDAELAALEAELAALESKPKKKAAKAAPPPVVEAPPSAEPAPAVPEKKGRFLLPKLGKKKEPAASAPLAPVREEAPAPAAPARAEPLGPSVLAPEPVPTPAPAYDLSLWRQEGDAWVRVVPETPLPVVRRILDEQGNVVREEPAKRRDVDSVGSVRAERGLGRLLRRRG